MDVKQLIYGCLQKLAETTIDHAQELLRQIVTPNPTYDTAMFMDVAVVGLIIAAVWHIIMHLVTKEEK